MTASVEWFDDLDAVAADAAGALDRTVQPILFDRLDWFRLTHGCVLPNARPIVLCVSDGADRAWLMLVEDGHRRAVPLASWYSLAFGPIFIGDGKRLLAPLLRAAAERYSRLALHPLGGHKAHMLCQAFAATGWKIFRHRISINWRIYLGEQNFAAYWAARPAKLRNTIARRERSHPLTIHIHRVFDAVAWADYEAIYAASWKPTEGSLPFLRALAEKEGSAGTLRLGVAHNAAGRAVAAQLWLVENDVATIHKLAHREDAKAGSPGSILSRDMFRAAIDQDHVRRIDFGLGDEPYKADWMDTSAHIFRIDAYRPATPHGLVGIVRELAGSALEVVSRLARGRSLD